MDEQEIKLNKKIKYIVAGAVAVFLCLCVTFVVTMAIRMNQRAMEARLEKTQNELLLQLEAQDSYMDYLLSSKFIEEYALFVLGYGKDGTKIFETAD